MACSQKLIILHTQWDSPILFQIILLPTPAFSTIPNRRIRNQYTWKSGMSHFFCLIGALPMRAQVAIDVSITTSEPILFHNPWVFLEIFMHKCKPTLIAFINCSLYFIPVCALWFHDMIINVVLSHVFKSSEMCCDCVAHAIKDCHFQNTKYLMICSRADLASDFLSNGTLQWKRIHLQRPEQRSSLSALCAFQTSYQCDALHLRMYCLIFLWFQ